MAGGDHKPSTDPDGRSRLDAPDKRGVGLLTDLGARLRGPNGAEHAEVWAAILNTPFDRLVEILKREGVLK